MSREAVLLLAVFMTATIAVTVIAARILNTIQKPKNRDVKGDNSENKSPTSRTINTEKDSQNKKFTNKERARFKKPPRQNISINPRLIPISTVCSATLLLYLNTNHFNIKNSIIVALATLLLTQSINRHAHSRKNRKITELLPNTLEMLSRSMKSGQSIGAAISNITAETKNPLKRELIKTAQEIELGMNYSDALKALSERCRSTELKLLTFSIKVHEQSGGNLSDIVEKLSKSIQEKEKTTRKISTITADARWSGIFLSIFPGIASGTIFAIDPQRYTRLLESGIPQNIYPIIVTPLIANIFVMRWLTKNRN